MTQGSPPTSSAQLLERAKAGDPDALDALIRNYLPWLRRWARGRVPAGIRGVLDTDDVVQETVLKAVRQIEQLPAEGNLQAYLRTALKNRLIDVYRKKGREPEKQELASGIPAQAPSPLEEVIGAEALARYEEALESLSEEDHAVIVLRLEMCRGYDEIAKAMDTNGVNQARTMVSRALKRLARKMRP